MSSKSIGEAVLTVADDVLTLTHREHPDRQLTFSAEDCRQLLAYLNEVVTRESNQRQAFRVPVDRKSGLKVIVTRVVRRIPVVPLSISMTGIFIEADKSLPLKMDDEVDVTIDYETNSITLAGTVRRIEPDGYGLLFRDSFRGEEITPPPTLSRIVMALQRRAK
jgi:hypothetical protein